MKIQLKLVNRYRQKSPSNGEFYYETVDEWVDNSAKLTENRRLDIINLDGTISVSCSQEFLGKLINRGYARIIQENA